MTVEKASGKEEVVPVKWSAPEVLERSEFSFASDVFAFAITMIEIYTDGTTPYPEMRNKEVAAEIQKGWRMPCPEGTPSSVFALIEICWAQNPKDRLTFEKISEKLKELHANASDFVKREKVDGSTPGQNARPEANDYNRAPNLPSEQQEGNLKNSAAHTYEKS